MLLPYQSPRTERVIFVGNTDTLDFTGITELSGPGDPLSAPRQLVPPGNKMNER